MKRALSRRSGLCVVLASLYATLGMAFGSVSPAQSMHDPTRPPAAISTPGAEAVRTVPVVQTVIITPLNRAAIIDGERVELGGRFREMQVMRITETEVVLRGEGRSEVLKLYPDVDKRTAKVFEAPPVKTRK